MLRRLARLVTVAALVVSGTAQADLVAGVDVIAAWTRQPGRFSDDGNPSRGKVLALDAYRLKLKPRLRRMHDVQYDRSVSVKGIPLAALVDAYPKAADATGVLLHFANGMVVPVGLDDLDELAAFLALETCDVKGKDCGVSFPDAPRLDVYTIDDDPQPTTFGWNKLVIARPWSPVERAVDRRGFSPWRHVDSLVGLEFVDLAAYRAQFVVGTSGGEEVFLHRCQYCHAARRVGASYGWDFVTPLALYEKRAPENLLNHVKYPKAMAQRLGLRMPPQRDIELDETRALWRWMRDVARKPLRPYQP